MDDKKLSFIMCTNDELAADEAEYYISRLNVPEGYSVSVIRVTEACSLTAGYNEGMEASDAKYKVYLHQDVFILNKNFIFDILKIFKDENIGMIGMVGTEDLPENGIMWDDKRVGCVFSHKHFETKKLDFDEATYGDEKLYNVQAIDGLLMATQYDLPWRDDIFTGWDFYDVSQSFEFRKAGYNVVVPYQKSPWCLHDDGYLNLENYYKYRKLFVGEYLNKT